MLGVHHIAGKLLKLNKFKNIVLRTYNNSQVFDNNSSDFLRKYRGVINQCFLQIANNTEYTAKAKDVGIQRSNWLPYIASSRRNLIMNPSRMLDSAKYDELCAKLDCILDYRPSDIIGGEDISLETHTNAAIEYLFNITFTNAEIDFRDSIVSYKALCNISDLRVPHEWFPLARLRKRKIIYHGGPTNSGKTYQAIQRLKKADPEQGGGLYCGPLRLLALEVYENLNKSGVYCNLITGQEQKELPFATHVASTLEMVQLQKEYDVVVIDEIQMICDEQRGHAWTKAVLGLQANEIHLCGGMEAYDIVKLIMDKTGDDFELCKYDRMSTLVVAEQSLKGDYSSVRKGDCVVAFSKQEIFAIKAEIEKLTKLKCAVIYGQLPSNIRSMQARLFNEDNTGYDVLVASDAIGMGLNLNIGRTIFHTTVKRGGGTGVNWLPPSQLKQIAGRAGRRNSNYPIGEVTAWQDTDLAYIRAVMQYDVTQIKAAGLFPTMDQIEIFSEHMKDALHSRDVEEEEEKEEAVLDDLDSEDSMLAEDEGKHAIISDERKANSVLDTKSVQLSVILDRFVELSKLDGGHYFMCNHDEIVRASNWLHTIPLTLSERFVFANAPASTRDPVAMNQLYAFAASYALKRPVGINILLPTKGPTDMFQFSDLCVKHNMIDLYIWLSWRFPRFFVERDACMLLRDHALELIESTLMDSTLRAQKGSLSEIYIELRKKIGANSSESFLPPDMEEFDAVRSTTKQYLEQLQSWDPVFRRKMWDKSNKNSKNSKSRSLSGSATSSTPDNHSSVEPKTISSGPKVWAKRVVKPDSEKLVSESIGDSSFKTKSTRVAIAKPKPKSKPNSKNGKALKTDNVDKVEKIPFDKAFIEIKEVKEKIWKKKSIV